MCFVASAMNPAARLCRPPPLMNTPISVSKMVLLAGLAKFARYLRLRATTQHSLLGVFALAFVADGLASVFGRATETEERPREFATTCAKKMLRVRSHFHENNSLFLRRERHKNFEVLQYHRTSSEATPLRSAVVAIEARGETAMCGLGHFPERGFQD